MGCTHEIINAHLGSEQSVKNFVDVFNDMLKDELDWKLQVDDFKRDNLFGYELNLDESPLFVNIERGGQFERVVKEFLKANPTAVFSANYYCAFSNCGDTTITTYEYNDGILTIDYRSGDMPYETYCEECEYDSLETDDDDAEPIVRLEDWEEGKVYTCPNCGTVIEFEAYHCVERIQIVE